MRFRAPSRRPGQRPRHGRVHLRLARGLAIACATSAAASAQGQAQLRFSIDFQGPTIADRPVPGGPRYSDSDLLVRQGDPFDPGPPAIAYLGNYLSRYGICLNHAPGVSCGVELNAFTFGRDARLVDDPQYRFSAYISVDEWASGSPIGLGPGIPTVFSEAAFREAASDTFALPLQGLFPFQSLLPVAVGVADGDGRRSSQSASSFPGVGLEEPLDPNSVSAADNGDNLDALDLGPPVDPAVDPLYFSLQAGFPLCNEPGVALVDSASLQTTATANPLVAPTTSCGSRPRAAAPPAPSGFMPPRSPGAGPLRARIGRRRCAVLVGQRRRLLPASHGTLLVDRSGRVQRGHRSAAVLGALRFGHRRVLRHGGASDHGGDVLIKYAGDPRPTIFVRAETLGLDTTIRGLFNDEVDGLDLVDEGEDPFTDCQPNGIEDAYDIASGSLPDDDLNGIPDDCEKPEVFCDCAAASSAPCNNSSVAGEGVCQRDWLRWEAGSRGDDLGLDRLPLPAYLAAPGEPVRSGLHGLHRARHTPRQRQALHRTEPDPAPGRRHECHGSGELRARDHLLRDEPAVAAFDQRREHLGIPGLVPRPSLRLAPRGRTSPTAFWWSSLPECRVDSL